MTGRTKRPRSLASNPSRGTPKKVLATCDFCCDNGGCSVSLRSSFGEGAGRHVRPRAERKNRLLEQSASSLLHDSCLGAKAKLCAFTTTNLVWIPSQVKYFSRIVQDFFVQIPASTALAWSTTGVCIEYVHARSLGKSGHGTTV